MTDDELREFGAALDEFASTWLPLSDPDQRPKREREIDTIHLALRLMILQTRRLRQEATRGPAR